jgi:pimeloyl-ACP methyl ester carboxylesterase
LEAQNLANNGYAAARTQASRLARLLVLAGVLVTASGCSSDDDGKDDGSSGNADFAQCVASLTPVCKTAEMDTAAEMNSSCKDVEFLPIPLSNGGAHGPVTVEGGPYGGGILWNQGAGTAFVNPVNPSEPTCLPNLIDLFEEPSDVTDDLKNTRDLDYSLYTVFRPACMKDGEKYPVITWANGTCGLPHGYAVFLGTLASYGYVIIASNSTWTNTAPTNGVQLRALDYAKALNEDSGNALYQRLDLGKVGAMGHSQGAAATAAVAADPRIRSVILWNGGTSNEKPFLNVAGERDIGAPDPAGMAARTSAATQPGAWLYHRNVLQTGGRFTGHLVLMEQPERVAELAVAWWDWQLNGNAGAKEMFVGDDCGLCDSPAEFAYGRNDRLR